MKKLRSDINFSVVVIGSCGGTGSCVFGVLAFLREVEELPFERLNGGGLGLAILFNEFCYNQN